MSALCWAEELERGEVDRADIARREGVSRARVTQILTLLELEPLVQERILSGTDRLSIRCALRSVGRHYN